ncbi:heavy-metal-associated domain-containing protein [Pedobacter panaciterrae]|jgi:Copper chaperone|uniref:Cation transporter n=1 Tax=Pedobacter panaciterrae TaxID=363849 RepID=A0ABU8NHB6_9SPHI|nr:cation transporter [Pedobacter panaciterrae]NQX56563.1 cation transporter [Pedobacter panaciterrae]
MQTLKFKTNIKCTGCIATVTPHLNGLNTIENWEVDLENPDKILKVEAEDELKATEIIGTLEKAGYKAEEV